MDRFYRRYTTGKMLQRSWLLYTLQTLVMVAECQDTNSDQTQSTKQSITQEIDCLNNTQHNIPEKNISSTLPHSVAVTTIVHWVVIVFSGLLGVIFISWIIYMLKRLGYFSLCKIKKRRTDDNISSDGECQKLCNVNIIRTGVSLNTSTIDVVKVSEKDTGTRYKYSRLPLSANTQNNNVGSNGISQTQKRKNFKNSNSSEKETLNTKNSYDERNVFTQTSEEKPINILNSMGRPFCQIFILNKNTATVQLDNSAVSLTVAADDLTSGHITCYASSFRNIAENFKRLQLSTRDDEMIASPAVEYHLSVHDLQEFAKIEMPFVGPIHALRCWKIRSDQGTSVTPDKEEIPRVENVDISPNLVTYYKINPFGKLVIYTKKFSWFVCTTCQSEHDSFGLRALIYGSLRTTRDRQRACVSLYIADEVHRLEDYKQHIEETERHNRRICLVNRQIGLPHRVADTDVLQLKLTRLNDPEEHWKHMVDPETNLPIHDIQVDIKLDHITKCHLFVSSGLPFGKVWHLEQILAEERVAFECIVKVTHQLQIHDGQSGQPVLNSFIIDALTEDTEVFLQKSEQRRAHSLYLPSRDPDIAEHPVDAWSQPSSAF